MYKFNADYKRTTQSTAFSLPLTLLDDLIETVNYQRLKSLAWGVKPQIA